MSNMRKIYIGGLLLCALTRVSAQNYDTVERHNSWNAGANVTGILTEKTSASYAEWYGNYNEGAYRNSYEATRTWNTGVIAKSITHLKEYSLIGAFSFDHTSGKSMNGSMFIHPGAYPVDLLEFTPGRKDRQTYSFMGGIATNIHPNWRIGGKIDFTSANYAKRKDLRHTNYRLDLQVAPSLMYHSNELAIGISYLFGKNSESIKAEVIGTAESLYNAFLDKGLMYGAYEAWDGSGIHLSESGINGFPIKELSHGGALQIQWKEFYGDIAYTHASGSAGERETIWFRFPTDKLTSHLSYRFKKADKEHFLRLNLEWSHQVNKENVLSKETANGITTTLIHGSNRIFEKEVFTANPEYEFTSPRGEFRLGASLSRVKQLSTQMYPYVASQKMFTSRTYVSGVLYTGQFDLKAGLVFSKGSFTDYSRTAEINAEASEPPYRLTDYYNWQNEYATASRGTITLGMRYHFNQKFYAEIQSCYTRGFKLDFINGANRWNETVKFGYTM